MKKNQARSIEKNGTAFCLAEGGDRTSDTPVGINMESDISLIHKEMLRSGPAIAYSTFVKQWGFHFMDKFHPDPAVKPCVLSVEGEI